MKKLILSVLCVLLAASAFAQAPLVVPAPSGSNSLKAFHFKDYPALGIYSPSAGTMYIGGTSGGITFTDTGVSFGGSLSATSPLCIDSDACLYRDAANTLAMRNGTNAQAFNVYNTYTDASNYEMGVMRFNGNVFQIGVVKQGSGIARQMRLGIADTTNIWFTPNNTSSWYMGNGGGGDLTPGVSDGIQIGSVTALVQNTFISRSIQGSKSKALTESSATAVTQIAVPQTAGANYADATIEWVVYATDGTDSQTLKGSSYLTAVNKAGTETCTVGAVGTAINAVSAGTLTCSASCITGLTDVVQFALNCVSSLTQTTLTAQARLDMMQPNTVTPQ
jgi:hypothetical protein